MARENGVDASTMPTSNGVKEVNMNEINDSKTSIRSKADADKNVMDPRLLDIHSDYFPPLEIVWKNILMFVYLHVFAVAGFYLCISGNVQWKTLLFSFMNIYVAGYGITAGAHRLFAHKSYKANLPLRILLTLMQTMAVQNSLHEWCRDHRVHHKYSETHADPHNAKRGFWFAHMGWLCCKKHPMVKEKGKTIDMSDLESDPVIMFQKEHYLKLVFVFGFLIPTLIPWYFWGEGLLVSWCALLFRYSLVLHGTWAVNSAAHLWGGHPYDKNINPAENIYVAVAALGEGWHNYHHTFPWDYKTAELGTYRSNMTTAFVDFFAKLGWAYDLKTVSEKVIAERMSRTGDGSLDHHHHQDSSGSGGRIATGPWGWGDADIPKEDMEVTEVLYPLINFKED